MFDGNQRKRVPRTDYTWASALVTSQEAPFTNPRINPKIRTMAITKEEYLDKGGGTTPRDS